MYEKTGRGGHFYTFLPHQFCLHRFSGISKQRYQKTQPFAAYLPQICSGVERGSLAPLPSVFKMEDLYGFQGLESLGWRTNDQEIKAGKVFFLHLVTMQYICFGYGTTGECSPPLGDTSRRKV
jgi:hypothetical protein